MSFESRTNVDGLYLYRVECALCEPLVDLVVQKECPEKSNLERSFDWLKTEMTIRDGLPMGRTSDGRQV